LKLSYDKIYGSQFESGHTSNWLIEFTGENGEKSLNILGGYAPIQDYSFEYTIDSKKIDLGITTVELEIPYSFNKPTHMSITWYETHKDEIINFFLNYFENIFPQSGRSVSLENLLKYSIALTLYRFDNSGKLNNTYYINIIPKGSLTIRGDQDMGLNNLPTEFTIVGFTNQKNK
jgi:hypothetical protein